MGIHDHLHFNHQILFIFNLDNGHEIIAYFDAGLYNNLLLIFNLFISLLKKRKQRLNLINNELINI